MKIIEFLLFLIPFFKPSYLLQFSIVNNLYNVAQILVTGLILLKFIKKEKISKSVIFVLFMELIVFLSSFVNNLDVMDTIKNIIQTVSMCIIVEYLIKVDFKKTIISLSLILNLLIFVDFVFCLVYPSGIRIGLYNVWFLGAKNGHIVYILPALFCNYIYCFLFKFSKSKLLSFLFLIFESYFILFTVNSSTSIIVISVLLFMLLFFNKSKLLSMISLKSITVMYLLLFLGIVVFNIQNSFSNVFEYLFAKDITFTGRTYIWKNAIYLIKKSALIGYGLEPAALRVIKFNNIAALHCHNMLLEILYEGGISLFSLFSMFWVHFCKNVDSLKMHNNFIKIFIIAYLIELLTEVFYFEVLLWLFILIIGVCNHKKEIWGES